MTSILLEGKICLDLWVALQKYFKERRKKETSPSSFSGIYL